MCVGMECLVIPMEMLAILHLASVLFREYFRCQGVLGYKIDNKYLNYT